MSHYMRNATLARMDGKAHTGHMTAIPNHDYRGHGSWCKGRCGYIPTAPTTQTGGTMPTTSNADKAISATDDIRNACALLTRAGIRLERSGLKITSDKVHDLTYALLSLTDKTEEHILNGEMVD